MAFVFADSVKETSTTTGTGTLDLAGAATGFRTFVAGIGTGNTCPYTIEDANGTAWEHGIGTVTDATPDTLARTTILSSSTGSAINLSAGTHTVYCAWPAERAQQVNLEHVAGTDAATSMAVGQMYVVDMSAWATADRTYTLPATALVGDRCGIMVSAGNASYELLVTAASGDTLNAVAGGTEWSRVFITGEVLIFRCIAASATWIVEYDGRIAQHGLMRLSTDAANETATTWTAPTSKSGAWTADQNVGSVCSTSNDRIIVRRAGKYTCSAWYISKVGASDQKQVALALTKTGTSLYLFQAYQYMSSTSSLAQSNCCVSMPMAIDDYVLYLFYTQEGARGALSHASNYYCAFSVVEELR